MVWQYVFKVIPKKVFYKAVFSASVYVGKQIGRYISKPLYKLADKMDKERKNRDNLESKIKEKE